MRFRFSYFLFLLASVVVLLNVSCKKTKLLTTGGELMFSTDTLAFDTVFTTQASFTNSFKIYNPQNEKVKISSVRMANINGYGQYFHLNVDGYPGKELPEFEIAPHDSAFVFVTVKIDPTNADNPFVIEDKIIATLNGKDYELPVTAYGQNAHYIVGEFLGTQTLLTDKPYVIMHSAAVDTNATLTIPAGCRIYMHADSRLYVYGTLKVNGTKTDSVVFQGDRLDRNYFGYEGYPGEWAGLYFFPISHNNSLQYTIIQNCGNTNRDGGFPAALYAENDASGNAAQVFLDHVTIQNSIGYGILSLGANITAENCLVHTCGAEALALIQGGTYNFKNCSFIVFGNDKVSHIQEPTGAILNYRMIDDTHYIGSDLNATLTNCVIWGSLENELACNKKDDFAYNVTLNNCIIRDSLSAIDNSVIRNNCILSTDGSNPDLKFADYSKADFHVLQGSALIDKGTLTNFTGIGSDLDDKPRTHNIIDIGCYEFQD